MERGEPLVVEVRRGPLVESRHAVHVAVVDAVGRPVATWGDHRRVTHPRSAVKPLQALPLVETGAADAADCTDVELALACASHSGEPDHVAAVEAWLARVGASPDDLECGAQSGRGASPAGNNCSGKHAGFLTLARHLGVRAEGYVRAEHPVQRLVTDTLAETMGVVLDPAQAGIDGCGIPAHALPLDTIAASAVLFAQPPDHWHPDRRTAARRLAAAMIHEPWFVAGTRRLCTDLLRAGAGSTLVKVGAEGVQWAALAEEGLGIALKVEDGARRASEIALGHVLDIVDPDGAEARSVAFDSRRRLTNHAGTEVGTLTVS